MVSSKSFKIGLIGSGNVGHHLGKRMVECGLEVVQVYSRRITRARKLARQLGEAEPINDLGRLAQRINIIILTVKDDIITEVALDISKFLPNVLVVHTSGAMPSTILKPFFRKHGSFYPLQSFSINRPIDFEMVPICIHSPQKRNHERLMHLAQVIAPNVYAVNDEQKSVLHVAAVFVNNFTNHLYHIAQKITEKEHLNFEILKPLLLETALKVQQNNPQEMQTGPARRGDMLTINKHLEYLKANESWATLYKKLSEGIQKEF
jgi:predicted short-subunit dehydrogenase-like oxidoreductase (DUF2520 family)